MTIAFILSSIGQESVNYQAKCKEFRQIRKHTCINLLLNPDSTFHYEEIAGDLPLVIESGLYSWTGDTLMLKTKEYGIIQYLKRKNCILPLNNTSTLSFKDRLHIDKKRAKT